MDWRGIPTAACPECGCYWLRISAVFDPNTYEIEVWGLDDAECYACGAKLTAPCPTDHPDNEQSETY